MATTNTPASVNTGGVDGVAGVDGEAITERVLKVATVEYDALKHEQRTRIRHRDYFVYLVAAAIAAVAAASATLHHAGALLALPLVSVLLGWTYVTNDDKVSDIGAYVRTVLTPTVAATVPAGTPVFHWESYRDPRRRLRKLVQLVADLTAFCVPATAAIATFWALGPRPPALLVVSIVELLLVAVLAVLIILYADLQQRAR